MRKIGIDLDNTIINYDYSVKKLSNKKYSYKSSNKKSVKKYIIKNYSEKKWMEFQGTLYGEYLKNSRIYDGFKSFIIRCKLHRTEIYIISHKSKYGHYDRNKINLRKTAKNFLIKEGIASKENKFFCIRQENIYFLNNQFEKIKKINSIGLDIFIDDLDEVLANKKINKNIRKILYSKKNTSTFENYNNWFDIGNNIYGPKNKNEINKYLRKTFKNSNYKYISNGKNNFCYRLNHNKGNVFIKFYNIKNQADILRQKREISAYKIFSKLHISPILLNNSESYNYIITEYLNLKKIKKINKPLIDNLLENLEKIKKIKINSRMHLANENIYEIDKFTKSLMLNIDTTFSKKKNKYKLISKFIPLIKNLSSNDNIDKSKLIFSLSDIGIHNMSYVDNKIIFYDFEYSGLDDPIKLALDFIYCPSNNLGKKYIEYWLINFYKIFKYTKFIQRLLFFNELISIKWKFIVLKHENKKNSYMRKILTINKKSEFVLNSIDLIN